jgi:KaiC/GvpD/RAD55 family RecA-like ATPase
MANQINSKKTIIKGGKLPTPTNNIPIKKAPIKKTPTTPKKQVPISNDHRSQTSIPGFDELVQGGFPKGASILICGGPGTGKTIFSQQYLINGATQHNEKGLLVSFEQRESDIRNQAKQFGWNLEELEQKGLIKIISIPVHKITPKTIDQIKKIVKKEGIKRLAIDSLSTLIINAPIYSKSSDMSVEDVMGENVMFSPPIIGDYLVQKFLYRFIDELKDLTECTTLLIGEADQTGQNISRDTLSEFACDGIVLINFESMGGEFSRSLIVRKMRQTKNDEDVHPLEISETGLMVHKIA